MDTHLMLVGGEPVAAAGNATFESYNPYTGQPWALVPRAMPDDIDRAVAAARSAFRHPTWRGLTASQRGQLLWRLADLVAERADELSRIETTDNGKLISEMAAQLRYVPEW